MFCKVKVNEWKNLKSFSEKLSSYLFRGQSFGNGQWKLEPTLERAAERYTINPIELYYYEKKLINEFQRGAQLHLTNKPPLEDMVGWLSIMQHYGSPTRLLDFTKSLYIAAFFATEQAYTHGSIWAVNQYKLIEQAIESNTDPQIIRKSIEKWDYEFDTLMTLSAEKYLNYENNFYVKREMKEVEEKPSKIIFVEPRYLTERSNIQKGVFLFSTNLEKSFDEVLFCNMISPPFNYSRDRDSVRGIKIDEFEKVFEEKQPSIIEFLLAPGACVEAIFDLDSMNINSATLFPGLDGYARSLSLKLRKEEKSTWEQIKSQFKKPKDI